MRILEAQPQQLTTLGEITLLMTRWADYCQYPIACISEWLLPPIMLDQVVVFRTPLGVLSGYATWALISEETERRLLGDPSVLLHFSEWNEGDRLWILDFLSLDGDIKRKGAQIAAALQGQCTAKSLRRDEDGNVISVTSWALTGRHGEQRLIAKRTRPTQIWAS